MLLNPKPCPPFVVFKREGDRLILVKSHHCEFPADFDGNLPLRLLGPSAGQWMASNGAFVVIQGDLA